MGSLPLAIYEFFNAADDSMHNLAWAGALLITAAVLVFSMLARILERRRS
jgi:phosphate transport system permease protein